jgi:hypothetical protein
MVLRGTQFTNWSAVSGLRTKSEVVRDWCNLYKVSALNYEMNTLIACYKADGEGILASVLNQLGLTQSLDLVKDASRTSKSDNKSSPKESNSREGGTPPLPQQLENLD